MSSDTPVTVKALLPGEKKIVKKFQLPEPVTISSLTEIIKKDLSFLDGCKLIITFRDDEDDEVILLTDEDLKTALSEFTENSKQDSFRVSVNIQEDALGHRGCPTCKLVRDSGFYMLNDANEEIGTFEKNRTGKEQDIVCESLNNENLQLTETADVLAIAPKDKSHKVERKGRKDPLHIEKENSGADKSNHQKKEKKQVKAKVAKKLQEKDESKEKKNKARVKKESKAMKALRNDAEKGKNQPSGAQSRKEKAIEAKEAQRKRWIETATNQKQHLQSLAAKQKERMDGLSSRLKSKLAAVKEAQEKRLANLMAKQIINLQNALKKQRVHMNGVTTKLKNEAKKKERSPTEVMQKQAKVMDRVRERNTKQIQAILAKQQRYRENVIRKQQQGLERVLQISIRQLMTAAQRFQDRIQMTSERQKSYWNRLAAHDRKLMRKQKRALQCLQRKHGSFLRKTAIKKQASLFKVRAVHLQITAKQTTKHANVSRKLIGKQDSAMNKLEVMALNPQTPTVITPNETDKCEGKKPVLSEEEKLEKLTNRFLMKLDDKNKQKMRERKTRETCEEKEELVKEVQQDIQEDNQIIVD